MDKPNIIDRFANYLMQASKKPPKVPEELVPVARNQKHSPLDKDGGSSTMISAAPSGECTGDSGGCD